MRNLSKVVRCWWIETFNRIKKSGPNGQREMSQEDYDNDESAVVEIEIDSFLDRVWLEEEQRKTGSS